MSEQIDFKKLLDQTSEASQRLIQVGGEIERDRLIPHLQAIFNAYRTALTDAKYAMPPALHLALANAQREVGEMRALQPARNFVSEADKVNAYAESGIRKDQREQREGRPDDFGVSACGRSDRAGQ